MFSETSLFKITCIYVAYSMLNTSIKIMGICAWSDATPMWYKLNFKDSAGVWRCFKVTDYNLIKIDNNIKKPFLIW